MTRKSDKRDGLQRLLDFIAFLKKEGIEFSIHNRSPEAITLDFAGVGIRFEVDFHVDEMVFSYFEGPETVHDGEEKLKELVREHWAD
jgi:hypothetical protein